MKQVGILSVSVSQEMAGSPGSRAQKTSGVINVAGKSTIFPVKTKAFLRDFPNFSTTPDDTGVPQIEPRRTRLVGQQTSPGFLQSVHLLVQGQGSTRMG
jgi:hypothetical protein